MNFHSEQFTYPIKQSAGQIISVLEHKNTLVVSAPTGSGKSTLLPLMLVNEPWLQNQKIIMLEPRRLAAKAIAQRMSQMIGEKVGETIGYRVRLETAISEKTRIEVVTEGILSRMLQSDNTLDGIGLVIFDEFHERSLNADTALALCRDMQQILRPELRILIMSATLDTQQLAGVLDSQIIEAKGRSFPVEIRYNGANDDQPVARGTALAIIKAVNEEKGDTLAFLPGESEIRTCQELLEQKLDAQFLICPLYGQLSQNEQQRAITPDSQGRRKIVLATSIAETSLTIEGIRIVVDSGLTRTQKYNAQSGLTRLETVMISKDMAQQRTGRAGRLEPGICYRLWNLAINERMDEHRTPEIQEAELSSLVLEMAMWGVTDIYSMTWLTPPPRAAVFKATALLEGLQALEKGKITDIGKEMYSLGCNPRIAHLLIRAKEMNMSCLACDLAAILEERDPLVRETRTDIGLRIEALRQARSRRSVAAGLARIEKSAALYARMLNSTIENGAPDPYQTGLLILQAFPERLARNLDHGIFQLASGARFRIDQNDDLSTCQWLAVAHLDQRESMGKIFLASPVSTDDLLLLCTERQVIAWETRKGGITANRELRFAGMLVKSLPLNNPDREVIKEHICQAIENEGEILLDFNEQVCQWQNRIMSLALWCKDQQWPDVSLNTLKATCREWLLPYLDGVSSTEDLKKLNLKEILQFTLPIEMQKQIELLAPQRIQVPSGSFIALSYFADGSQPILAVRLQECFGLAQTPRVCRDTRPVLMHLLSPGFKPVQITSDLSSFWNNAYFDVRKELKSRYPKHVWPEDPWTQMAVKGTKKQNKII